MKNRESGQRWMESRPALEKQRPSGFRRMALGPDT